jgi:hypothetical protein
MLTFTSILLVLAMIPPASKAIADAINRTCALDMFKTSLIKYSNQNLKPVKFKIC